jgi:hypothetical protein
MAVPELTAGAGLWREYRFQAAVLLMLTVLVVAAFA